MYSRTFGLMRRAETENEELIRLRSETEFYKRELAQQREEFEKGTGKSQVDLVAKLRLMESQLEEAYKDKMKFQVLLDEQEMEMERREKKNQQAIEDAMDMKSQYNEETNACHDHIRHLNVELKRKSRRLENFESYMSQRVIERKEMQMKMQEMEERLQMMNLQNRQMQTLQVQNQFLIERNSTLYNMLLRLREPESQREAGTALSKKSEDSTDRTKPEAAEEDESENGSGSSSQDHPPCA